jgi:cytidine deaminase
MNKIIEQRTFLKAGYPELEDWMKQLVDEAKEAMQHAVPPVSGYHVGAAILAASGKIYKGANYESAIHNNCSHAEMMSIDKAIFAGERKFSAIAISVVNGPGLPCGNCRQKIYEADSQMQVIGSNQKGEIIITTIDDLFPLGFSARDLGIDISKY